MRNRSNRAVGSAADLSAGAVRVVVADFAIGRVVIDHRVHVPRAHGEEHPRPAELAPWLGAPPGRLAQDRDAEAFALEQPPDQRHRETRMIDVRIARDKDDIDRVPAAGFHLGAGHRQRLRRGQCQRHPRTSDVEEIQPRLGRRFASASDSGGFIQDGELKRHYDPS